MFPRAVVGRPVPSSACTLILSLAVLIGQVDAPAAERYAFLVGVRQYDKTQLNDLQFSENDVQGLSTTLQESGYSKRNIVLMTQSVGASNPRLAPFAKNIQKELALVLRESQAGDSVLVAFSGHGVQLAGDAESYFCPADANLQDRATLIPLGDVFKSLQACKAAVKILLVDACRNDPVSSLGKSRRVVDLETLSRQAPPTPPGGIAAFFSCSKGEQSFEHPDLKHGIFFHFVIQGLSGKADFDNDQQISLAELELYAVKEVQSYSRIELGTAQTPERRDANSLSAWRRSRGPSLGRQRGGWHGQGEVLPFERHLREGRLHLHGACWPVSGQCVRFVRYARKCVGVVFGRV